MGNPWDIRAVRRSVRNLSDIFNLKENKPSIVWERENKVTFNKGDIYMKEDGTIGTVLNVGEDAFGRYYNFTIGGSEIKYLGNIEDIGAKTKDERLAFMSLTSAINDIIEGKVQEIECYKYDEQQRQ